MKKILLLLSLSAMLFSCATKDYELLPMSELNGLLDSECIFVNPDGSKKMAVVGTPIYPKMVNDTTVHFFWDSHHTMRAMLTYDIVLRYDLVPTKNQTVVTPTHTFARVVRAGSISAELSSRLLYISPPYAIGFMSNDWEIATLAPTHKYVLTGTKEYRATRYTGGLFHRIEDGRMYFYADRHFFQQAYLPYNVVVKYGIMKTTTTDTGTTTELIEISEWIVPQWCESFSFPGLADYFKLNPDGSLTIISDCEYIIFSCVWQNSPL